MLVGSDSEERQVIGGVQVPHSTPSLGSKLLDLTSILHCSGIVQGGANWNAYTISKHKERNILINAHLYLYSSFTFLVYNNDTSHAFVTLNPLQCFFYFGLLV